MYINATFGHRPLGVFPNPVSECPSGEVAHEMTTRELYQWT